MCAQVHSTYASCVIQLTVVLILMIITFLHVSFQYIIDPHNTQLSMDVALNNPLSQEEDVSDHFVFNISESF